MPVICSLKSYVDSLKDTRFIKEVTVFKALLFPPGRNGKYLQEQKKKQDIHSRFDVVVLLQLSAMEIVSEFKLNAVYRELIEAISNTSSYHLVLDVANVRRIDTVNHQKKGVFLFNYFIAESKEKNVAIWEYTAGWFQEQTGLDNSTLFHSSAGIGPFSVINHCRWNRIWDVLPSLVFKKSFKTYVLDNFAANNVAANPVLYRLA